MWDESPDDDRCAVCADRSVWVGDLDGVE